MAIFHTWGSSGMDCKTAQQKIMPYIERKLSPAEAEDFIAHVRGCKECSEELEVYFTIYYALEKLDNDATDTFDIQGLLERDLQQSEKALRRYHMRQFYRRVFVACGVVFAAAALFTAGQFLWYGSGKQTTFYQIFLKEDGQSQEAEATEGASDQTRADTAKQGGDSVETALEQAGLAQENQEKEYVEKEGFGEERLEQESREREGLDKAALEIETGRGVPAVITTPETEAQPSA